MPRVRVSVVMPLFNKAAYIEEAIASVVAQGNGVGEIIVVDDGSTDAGPALVADMAASDARIRLISQANGGVSSARNAGVRAAREELVAFLDADDWYLPGYIDAMLELAHSHKTVAMLCSGYVAVFPDGTRQRHVFKPANFESWCGEVSDFYRDWSRASFTFTSAIIIRRETFLQIGVWFPEGERLGEDQDVWFRMAESGTVVCRNAPLVAYRKDVMASATYGGAPTDLLPCYQRLSDRLLRGEVPSHMAKGGRRLVASHILNVANARLAAGNVRGARALLADPRARSNLRYLAKSLFKYAVGQLTPGVTAS